MANPLENLPIVQRQVKVQPEPTIYSIFLSELIKFWWFSERTAGGNENSSWKIRLNVCRSPSSDSSDHANMDDRRYFLTESHL